MRENSGEKELYLGDGFDLEGDVKLLDMSKSKLRDQLNNLGFREHIIGPLSHQFGSTDLIEKMSATSENHEGNLMRFKSLIKNKRKSSSSECKTERV